MRSVKNLWDGSGHGRCTGDARGHANGIGTGTALGFGAGGASDHAAGMPSEHTATGVGEDTCIGLSAGENNAGDGFLDTTGMDHELYEDTEPVDFYEHVRKM